MEGCRSTTHVAGPWVGFKAEDRLIQRCMVCGEKLIDLKPSCTHVAVPPENQDEKSIERYIPTFSPGRMIQVSEGNPKQFLDVGDFKVDPLPDDFCLALVEE